MTKYREIIRLVSLNLSQTNIALSCGVSKKTVNTSEKKIGIACPENICYDGQVKQQKEYERSITRKLR